MKLTDPTQDELLLTCSWCHRRLREDEECFGAGARVGPEAKGLLANNEGKLLPMQLATDREIIVMVPTAGSEARAAGNDVYFQTCSERSAVRISLEAVLVSLSIFSLALGGCSRKIQSSAAMEPTIKRGEKVMLDATAYVAGGPKRWDVVAFEPPGGKKELWLKRVVALPGDNVSFATGGIAVNGKFLVLPPHLSNVTYVSLDHPAFNGAAFSSIASPYTVPPNSYFVLGDNSTNSSDSRFWGAVFRTNIIAKVRNK